VAFQPAVCDDSGDHGMRAGPAPVCTTLTRAVKECFEPCKW
jgi:hypothetical protein